MQKIIETINTSSDIAVIFQSNCVKNRKEEDLFANIDDPDLLNHAIHIIHDCYNKKNKPSINDSLYTLKEGQKALDIHLSKIDNSENIIPIVLESLLLLSNDYRKISDAIGINEKIVEIYAKIFYYVCNLSYLEKYNLIIKEGENTFSYEVKEQALKFGFDFICHFYLDGQFDVNKMMNLMEKRLVEEFFFDSKSLTKHKKLVDIYSLLKKNSASDSENNVIHTLAVKILKESYSETESE